MRGKLECQMLHLELEAGGKKLHVSRTLALNRVGNWEMVVVVLLVVVGAQIESQLESGLEN